MSCGHNAPTSLGSRRGPPALTHVTDLCETIVNGRGWRLKPKGLAMTGSANGSWLSHIRSPPLPRSPAPPRQWVRAREKFKFRRLIGMFSCVNLGLVDLNSQHYPNTFFGFLFFFFLPPLFPPFFPSPFFSSFPPFLFPFPIPAPRLCPLLSPPLRGLFCPPPPANHVALSAFKVVGPRQLCFASSAGPLPECCRVMAAPQNFPDSSTLMSPRSRKLFF